MLTEPTIARPAPPPHMTESTVPADAKAPRYIPQRGLVRRIRRAAASDGLSALAAHHRLDRETRELLSAELVKLGAPPITEKTATEAFERLVHFDPLNADALRPFLIIGTNREDRALAVAKIATAMRRAGRSVRMLSDAADATGNVHLKAAGEKLGCGVQIYDGTAECVEMLRISDLACLSIVEAGLRPPLDRVALLRLHKLCIATGAEPIAVVRPADALQALGLARIGVRRMIIAETGEPVRLGSALSAARRGDLAFAEMLPVHDPALPLRPAMALDLATMLLNFEPD